MRDYVKRVHFVGVGGSGMSGVAEVLLNLGYAVSGSDLQESASIGRLRDAGARIEIGHAAGHIEGCDVVVVSAAIAEDNVELVAAAQHNVPVIPRAEMLGELMRFRRGIAVAGTHGKTTTTSLIANVLAQGGLDPTFVVGGLGNSVDSNARLGSGEYLVAEADESDASFLHLQPWMAVVTNIDADHMGTYGGDFGRLTQTFVNFLHNLPFYGLAVLCIDDPNVQRIKSAIRKPVITYGTDAKADLCALDVVQHGTRMRFRAVRAGRRDIDVELAIPGNHNVLNALAAIAIGQELGIDDAAIVAALAGFEGIGRRFQLRGAVRVTGGEAVWVDYDAHHPRELAATLQAAAGSWPERRRVAVFQPHRYTRTRDLLDDFAQVLERQDPLIITEVYPAGETPISGADGRALCRAIRARVHVDPVFVENLTDLPKVLAAIVRHDDIILTLGAGDIGQISRRLAHMQLAVQQWVQG